MPRKAAKSDPIHLHIGKFDATMARRDNAKDFDALGEVTVDQGDKGLQLCKDINQMAVNMRREKSKNKCDVYSRFKPGVGVDVAS